MGMLGWIILGGLAGWIPSPLTGSRDGRLMNVVIGIVGTLVGGSASGLRWRHSARLLCPTHTALLLKRRRAWTSFWR